MTVDVPVHDHPAVEALRHETCLGCVAASRGRPHVFPVDVSTKCARTDPHPLGECPDYPKPRLGHCTPVWGGHSPACDRDGTYCYLSSSHEGPCKPHINRAAMDRRIHEQADGYFGFNPVKTIVCPHCGGRMEALDAVAHVSNADLR